VIASPRSLLYKRFQAFLEDLPLPLTLLNGGLEVSSLLRQHWSVKALAPRRSAPSFG